MTDRIVSARGPEMSAAEVAERKAEAAPGEAWIDAVTGTPGLTERILAAWWPAPGAYVTEVSVPVFGDGGVQRLHSHMTEPEPGAEL